jgi:hypothetical protein
MRNPAFIALLDEIRALHDAKNSDYASDSDPLSNFRRSEAFGVPAFKGALVRLSDKWSRIEQLTSGKVPKNESLRDSLIDSAVYSLIAILLLEEMGPGQKAPVFENFAPVSTTCEHSSTGQGPEECVGVGPQGYVTAEHLRMSR